MDFRGLQPGRVPLCKYKESGSASEETCAITVAQAALYTQIQVPDEDDIENIDDCCQYQHTE